MKKKFLLIVAVTLSLVLCSQTIIYSQKSPEKESVSQDKTYDQLKLLLDILTYTQQNYVTEVDTQKLIYSAASGMMRPLDPFSQFMEPKIYEEMKIETEGKYGGLGIRISIKEDWLTVITPMPGTPAARIGILPLDKIIKIEGETTKGITMEEAVKKLRGDPGTKVKITIIRENVKEPMEFEITRELIKLETIRYKMIDDTIGYIQLIEFNQNAYKDMEKALDEIKSKITRGLIFDLRNNPGGLLDSAVEISKFFLGDEKMIVYTKGKTPQSNREYHAAKSAKYPDVPVVVLINRGSASGSEIVAGALQDHKRAVVIGSRTFGKASVQSVLPLSGGSALKLTTAKYYTPSGRLIQVDTETKKGGIEPDIKIEVTPETEAKLIAQQEVYYPPGQEQPKAAKEEKVTDEVLERAVSLLKAREIFFSK
ncbi:MAG: S41 family peptidase [Elusimicrobiota bacterium]